MKYAKTPTVYQMEATECGAASLSMIFAYWGKNLPLEQMRIETGVSRDGCSAGNIMRAAKKFGMECHGYSKEPEALKSLDVPCMIHWNFNHFVVFEGFKGKYAYINDPAMGRRKLTKDELDDGFTGIVLTFKPTSDFTKQKKQQKLIPMIKERITGVNGALAQLIITGLLLVIPGLIIPVLSQFFIDHILGRTNNYIVVFTIFLSLTIVFKACLLLYRGFLLCKLQNRLVYTSSKKFLTKLFRLPISFFDQRYVGDLTSRVENNENLNVFISSDLAEMFLNIFIAAFYLFLLLSYNAYMTLVGLAGIVINFIVAWVASKKISSKTIKMQQDMGKLNGVVCAGISITSTLKASGAESSYTSRILGYDAKAMSKEQEINKVQTIIGAIPSAVSSLFEVLLMILGMYFVLNGDLTLGMLTAFISLFGSFVEPIESLVSFVKNIQKLKADMARVDDIFAYPTDEKYSLNVNEALNNSKLSGEILCDKISFGYSRLAKPLVTDFTFSLDSGSSVAFVGSSGCGKSTVSKIISGLYLPWDGEIRLDGVPMNEIPPEVLHASVSTVSQNITIFAGTIRDNITLWNKAIDEKDIINAAKDACIHELITQKPGAYDYMLSEGGRNISGGQRQRIEIARALVTNPTILIMDEATSALDPIIEKQIVDNIKRRGCTCIIIAHRLSAVRDCDQIIVMKNGIIVQRGTPEELEKSEGYYREFMKSE